MKAVLFSAFLPLLAFGNPYPFGPAVKMDQIRDVDKKGCEAGGVLKRATISTGVDLTNGKAKSWSCTGVTYQDAIKKRCPQPSDTAKENMNVKCYANSESGPVVCLKDPKTEIMPHTYAQGLPAGYPKLKTELYLEPRFSELHVLVGDGEGGRLDSGYRMDDKGCQVQAFHEYRNSGSNRENGNFESCADLLYRATTGQRMEPDSERFPGRFCHPNEADSEEEYVGLFLYSVKDISRCQKFIPGFEGRYKEWRKQKAKGDDQPARNPDQNQRGGGALKAG